VAVAALQYYPLPNRPGTSTNAANYAGNSESSLDRDVLVARVDHEIAAGDRLTARYYINDSGTRTGGSYGNPIADPDADRTRARIQSVTTAYTHIAGASLVNELRATYLRRAFRQERPGPFPAFTIPGYASLSATASSRVQTPITDRQLLESLSWFRGTHAFKFGGEVRAGANDEIRDRGSSATSCSRR